MISNAGDAMHENTRSIRVLHLLRWLTATGGGIRTYLASVVQALAGSHVELAGGAVESGNPPKYIQALHSGSRSATALANVCSFGLWARRAIRDADVVHIHGVFGWTLILGAPFCILLRVPYVVCPHAELDPWYLVGKRAKKILYLYLIALPLLRRSAAVVSTTEANTEILRNLDHTLKVFTVLPGVFVPDRPSVHFLDHSASDTELRIIYLGRMDPVKDVPTLIRAVSKLCGDGIPATLDIVGWGIADCVAEVHRIVAELGLEAAVRFPGYLDGEEKLEIMRRAHVMAIPSHAENFSFATAEALAIGLPAVVTTGVALSRHIAQHDCGSVVPPGDVNALSAALAVYANPEVRKQRALNAHQYAQSELSLAAMGRSLEKLYFEASGKPQLLPG